MRSYLFPLVAIVTMPIAGFWVIVTLIVVIPNVVCRGLLCTSDTSDLPLEMWANALIDATGRVGAVALMSIVLACMLWLLDSLRSR